MNDFVTAAEVLTFVVMMNSQRQRTCGIEHSREEHCVQQSVTYDEVAGGQNERHVDEHVDERHVVDSVLIDFVVEKHFVTDRRVLRLTVTGLQLKTPMRMAICTTSSKRQVTNAEPLIGICDG